MEKTEDKIVEILKDISNAAYWYGEDTGDYDMDRIDGEDYFKKAVSKIKELINGGGKDDRN